MDKYVHGYSKKEAKRLKDQARTLTALLHADTAYPEGSRVLEAGCGIGAQTVPLAQNSPKARITAIDLSDTSLAKAKETVRHEGISNVEFEKADIFDLPYGPETFDHIFICFVLEHLENPLEALENLKGVLKDGGSITVIEGDHGSYYCHPQSPEASLAVDCLIKIQKSMGGDSLIGRRLYPLMVQAGLSQVQVSPRMVYVDASKPELVDGFTRKTFIAMVEGVKEKAIAMQMIDEKTWNKGIADLYRTTLDDGTFCYTFFKAQGTLLRF